MPLNKETKPINNVKHILFLFLVWFARCKLNVVQLGTNSCMSSMKQVGFLYSFHLPLFFQAYN